MQNVFYPSFGLISSDRFHAPLARDVRRASVYDVHRTASICFRKKSFHFNLNPFFFPELFFSLAPLQPVL